MAKPKLRFTAKIEGKEAGVVAAIAPPVDVAEFFGTRGRVPVRGTINGYPFRSSLTPCLAPRFARLDGRGGRLHTNPAAVPT